MAIFLFSSSNTENFLSGCLYFLLLFFKWANWTDIHINHWFVCFKLKKPTFSNNNQRKLHWLSLETLIFCLLIQTCLLETFCSTLALWSITISTDSVNQFVNLYTGSINTFCMPLCQVLMQTARAEIKATTPATAAFHKLTGDKRNCSFWVRGW